MFLKNYSFLKLSILDDQWVLSFLRGSKFSLQRTKEKLEFYYVMRSLCPEFYTNRNAALPEIKVFLEQR